MKEKEFALQLIKKAEECWNPKNKKVQPVPSILVDKKLYKKYNIDLIKQTLEENGYNIFDGPVAPAPYNIHSEGKFVVLKKE